MLIKKNSFYVDFVDISITALKKIEKKNKNKNIKTFNKSFNEFLKHSKKKYVFKLISLTAFIKKNLINFQE